MNRRFLILIFVFAAVFIFAFSCTVKQQTYKSPSEIENFVLFKEQIAETTGINFENKITENNRINILNYLYYYNGSGVAVGDINNDGLPDIYFAATTGKNKLFLNQGNLRFKDISRESGTEGRFGITTGVSFVDINNDGFLDIYVCKSGDVAGKAYRANQLFINNGNMQFLDMAEQYGLADASYSNQAYFFDMDRDGDLDMYLVNHPVDWLNANKIMTGVQEANGFNYNASDKLYENNGKGKFEDITETAGVKNRAWGLSASVGDFNGDGWPDIYVANDFIKPDFLYINNKDGTFSDEMKEHFRHISFYSMGTDYADINNDGHNDLYVVDMAMKGHERSKRNMGSMSTENFQTIIRRGYHYNYSTNTLQLNLGNNKYVDIGQSAGVDKTDWSWSPLIADFDNDGFKDIFVSNGVYKDIIDNDFLIKKTAYDKSDEKDKSYDEILNKIPQSRIKNFFYKNNKNLTFTDNSEVWGIKKSSNSNGSAYVDLDMDGDLDIVVNNFNEPSFIYENQAQKLGGNYVKVKLEGAPKNRMAIGSSVRIYYNGNTQRQDFALARGYLSSSSQILHFGLGQESQIDSMIISWPAGMKTIIKHPGINKTHIIAHQNVSFMEITKAKKAAPIYAEKSHLFQPEIEHEEDAHDDFEKESLLPHKLSQNGPYISICDVNGDGLEDFFVGGAAGNPSAIYRQDENGYFHISSQDLWLEEKDYEDMKSVFFDADGDGDKDLYVVSGSNEFTDPKFYQDRLYLNDGAGNFKNATDRIPTISSSGASVDAADFDQDGDIDLIVGGRVVPGKYPSSPKSYLLENINGKFQNSTREKAPDLESIGMVTDLEFTDYDADGDLDILAIGEWMGLEFLENKGGFFESKNDSILSRLKGWWQSIKSVDIDKDGDVDYVLGNIGTNNKYHPTKEKPLHLYYSDFDENGTGDIVLSKKEDETFYPVRGRECSSEQMPFIANKFPNFESFAKASMSEIYTDQKLNKALHLQVTEFRTCMLINEGAGNFQIRYLPTQAQISPVVSTEIVEVNKDGLPDLLLVGNMFETETETIRYDAGFGLVLQNGGDGTFSSMNAQLSGIYLEGNVKDIKAIILADGLQGLLVGINNEGVQLFSGNSSELIQ
ncbi:MAG: VCBS repeat-containing protein [Cyclobacteriaceae bacterium]